MAKIFDQFSFTDIPTGAKGKAFDLGPGTKIEYDVASNMDVLSFYNTSGTEKLSLFLGTQRLQLAGRAFISLLANAGDIVPPSRGED